MSQMTQIELVAQVTALIQDELTAYTTTNELYRLVREAYELESQLYTELRTEQGSTTSQRRNQAYELERCAKALEGYIWSLQQLHYTLEEIEARWLGEERPSKLKLSKIKPTQEETELETELERRRRAYKQKEFRLRGWKVKLAQEGRKLAQEGRKLEHKEIKLAKKELRLREKESRLNGKERRLEEREAKVEQRLNKKEERLREAKLEREGAKLREREEEEKRGQTRQEKRGQTRQEKRGQTRQERRGSCAWKAESRAAEERRIDL